MLMLDNTILYRHLISFQGHIHRLYDNGVIDQHRSTKILLAIDHLCHSLKQGNAIQVSNRLYRYYKQYGSPSLTIWFEFMELTVTANELFALYSDIFVPFSIKLIPDCQSWELVRCTSNIDCLCFTECKIRMNVCGRCYEFEGFIDIDSLNIKARSLTYINKIKARVIESLNKFPDVSLHFVKQYLKLTKSGYLFTGGPNQIIEKIRDDANFLEILDKKTGIGLVASFTNNPVKTMFRYINLLLLGSEKNIKDAAFLYTIVNDAKIPDRTIARCIYNNLSFRQQVMLNRVIETMPKPKHTIPESLESKMNAMPNLPHSVREYILEKQKELKTNGDNSAKINMAINGLLKYPWKPAIQQYYKPQSLSDARKYLDKIKTQLDESVYGHHASKIALIELVAKWLNNPQASGQVIGLVGQPGVGKTLMARAMGKALDIPVGLICLGGMEDPVDLVGHSFTYSSAQYGMIIRQMIQLGSWRSILFFDEVDKVSRRGNSSEIHNILIHLTDPNTRHQFHDRFYSSAIDFDLSGTLIVFSYNDSSLLHPILLDRITEIKLPSFSLTERIDIVHNHLVPDLSQDIGFGGKIILSNETISYLIHQYTCEAGIRSLKRLIEQILLKLNLDSIYQRGPYVNCHGDTVEEILDHEIEITTEMIDKYLDRPKKNKEVIHSEDRVGLVHGMYATNMGVGGVLSIQIYENHYKDERLKITGNQKTVMLESVECALTAAMNTLSLAERKDAAARFSHGFHVHVPDAATPKDGPSAGCAFATAFVSIMLNAPVNRFVAMSGEIDLLGDIKAIGGLEEKLWGAKQAGIKTVVLSKENKPDYLLIEQRHGDLGLRIKFVSHLKDIVLDPEIMKTTSKNDLRFH